MKQKSKILLITNLYPQSSDHSLLDATRALHNFVISWSKSAEVIVVRPQRRIVLRPIRLKNLFYRRRENRIDDIMVYILPYINILSFRRSIHDSFLKLLVRQRIVPDIVLSHGFLNVPIGDRLSARYSVPHIVGVHNSDLRNINLYKEILSRSARIACRSFSIRRRFLEKLPEFGDKVFVANSGIGEDKILKKAEFIKKADSAQDNTIKIISVCSLIPLKNIDIVLRALSDLSSAIHWHYTIIGDGPERKNLEGLAQTLGIDDKVSFMGYVENPKVYKFLDESNIFAMVSSPETFGLSYLEAMARGNIVIGTKGWGIDGIVIDGVNGYLCDEISAVNVRSKIMEIITMSPTERRNMQNHIFVTIKDYTIKEMSQVYLDVIEQCIQENKPKII